MDPLCCWNAPGPRFFTILASLFLHFCVGARYKEQLFNTKNEQKGFHQRTKKHFKKQSQNASTTEENAHSETLSSGPSPPQTVGGVSHFLLMSLHVFLGRVHGDAEIVPEKNRESFPLSANVFWCWSRMLLWAEYWGVLK